MKNNTLKNLSISDIISMVNEGDADAMNELGIRYDNGEGVEKNEKKAFDLFNKASEKNCIKAKFNLAMCYLEGTGTEKNETNSFNILKELTEKYNHAKSYYYLGDFYFWGGPVEINYEKSFYYYNQALKIDSNYLKAKFAVAYAYYSGKGTEKNFELAFNMFEELLDKYNYIDAYFYLGELYYLGKVTQPDHMASFNNNNDIKALMYFYKSLKYKKNIYASKYYIGEMYMLGKGVEEPNCLRAKMYFEDILNETHDDAYYKLALINSGNFGMPKNEEKSEEYFNKIECDLCITMLYYILAVKPVEEHTLDELLKLLNSEMSIVKNHIRQFPLNHPAKKYYNRLSSLKKDEFNDIVEKLKNKIIIYKEEKKIKDTINTLSSDSEVLNLAKCIVRCTDSHKIQNNEFPLENNKKTILKFCRHYYIDDEETGKVIVYDDTKKDFNIENNTILNIPGISCNTKITIKKIYDGFVELQIEDIGILTIENIAEGCINVIIEKGKKYEYSLPSSYFLGIEIL